MTDLFSTPELIPEPVNDILTGFNDFNDPYIELAKLQNALIRIGYTFDYYLDATPFNLRKL